MGADVKLLWSFWNVNIALEDHWNVRREVKAHLYVFVLRLCFENKNDLHPQWLFCIVFKTISSTPGSLKWISHDYSCCWVPKRSQHSILQHMQLLESSKSKYFHLELNFQPITFVMLHDGHSATATFRIVPINTELQVFRFPSCTSTSISVAK